MLKIAWSNGNLISGSVTSTQASAEVTRNGEDVTGEYAASAFAWKRDSGNASADATWNAAHAGKKVISLTEADLNGDVKISCTLTGNGPSYGSIAVDEDMDATHTRGTLDANDTFQIVNGELKVTTSRGEVYALQDGEVKGAGAKLNGSITAQSRLFASQPEDVVEFAYNHKKLRTQKSVTRADGTVELTDYTLCGKMVTHLTRGSDKMHFFYDVQKQPIFVEYNGEMYSYVHNLQGDIVGILDSSGNLVVEYKYNVWGKLVSLRTLTTAYDTLAELNPFRYRGYVWDGEIGLYYLKSRYYNAEFCRMINADSLILLRGIYENNVFAYCVNAPSVFKDPSGNHFQKVFQKISGVVNWLKKAIADVSEKVNEYIDNLPEITIGEVNYYKTHTELTIFVDRKIDYYTTEYNVYYLEIATGAQRDDYFLLKSSDDDNGFFNFLASVSGSVVGAIIGPGFIEGVLGGLIVTGVVSFFDDVENDFNDSLTELYQSLENSESESGIAYIERTYYTNKEGFHTSPIYVDCYYIEWKG